LGEAFTHEDRRDRGILRGGLELGTPDLGVDEVVEKSPFLEVPFDEGGELLCPCAEAARGGVLREGELVEAWESGFLEALVGGVYAARGRRQ
jgi:hypothetical protein